MDFQVLIFTGSRYGVTSELSDLVSICNNWSLQSWCFILRNNLILFCLILLNLFNYSLDINV
jgi:hypothetical protein